MGKTPPVSSTILNREPFPSVPNASPSREIGAAPVSCSAPDGTRYRVNVQSVLPEGDFRVAGLTAYGTGLIVSTVSTGEALVNLRNETGVSRAR